MNEIIFSCIYEERKKLERLEALLKIKDKTLEQIQEQNELVEEKDRADEMLKAPEIKEMVDLIINEAKALSETEIDFVLGSLYGMLIQISLRKDYPEERKYMFIRMYCRTVLQLRRVVIREMHKNRIRTIDPPLPIKE